MKTLQVDQATTVLRITGGDGAMPTLTEQAAPHLEQSPRLILDVGGIQFTSMLIGEMVNLHRSFEERWKERPHQIALVNITPTSRQVFESTRLDKLFRLFDSLTEAFNRST